MRRMRFTPEDASGVLPPRGHPPWDGPAAGGFCDRKAKDIIN
jgi:hypothetical protein